MSGSKRQLLPEFIAIRVPTRDRRGRLLAEQRHSPWVRRLKQFLLQDLDIGGLEEDRVEGLWRGEYDAEADDFQLVTEECLIVRCYCRADQLREFSVRGEGLLIEMGSDLDQDAMAYETREGLIVLYMTARE